MGYYTLGKCDGSTTYDTTRCAPCAYCQPGQYISKPCDGTTYSDSTLCIPCNNTSCKSLNILEKQCTGRGFVDASQCTPCSDPGGSGCLSNQYMHFMCDGSSLYNGVCRSCATSCLGPTASLNSSLGNASFAGGGLAPTGQYKLIDCTGKTSTNLVCGNCTQQCPVGSYVTNLCSGTGSTDTVRCQKCTCPAGTYALNNTCSGTTIRNTLQCIPCTQSSSCPPGYYLYGECSTFSNPVCIQCRPPCGSVEVEISACSSDRNRFCLPNNQCFEKCPAGFFESRACKPPSVMRECTACTACPAGYYIQQPCSRTQDTVCQKCVSASFCTDDSINAVFCTVGICNGSSTEDAARCGVANESYGQNCSRNYYK